MQQIPTLSLGKFKKILRPVVRTIRSITQKPSLLDTTVSFSQSGEDRIIAFLCAKIGISLPTYLDIGANHPIKLSNTYLFYRHGSHGVCVEADPLLCSQFQSRRKRDRCINKGVGTTSGGEMLLHVFDKNASGLNTFSPEWAAQAVHAGHSIVRKIPVPIIGINDLLHDLESVPNLLTIDIEGSELPVLKAFDFSIYRPEIICVETFQVVSSNNSFRNEALIELIQSRGYRIFADTWINTIFVRTESFPQH